MEKPNECSFRGLDLQGQMQLHEWRLVERERWAEDDVRPVDMQDTTAVLKPVRDLTWYCVHCRRVERVTEDLS